MKCRGRSSSVKEKAMNTCYARYGVSNFAKTKECLKKQREAWAKRGGHWAAQAAQADRQSYGEKIRLSHERTGAIERGMATKKERYGKNWGKHLAKRATRTMQERYGDHWFATERGKEETRKGMIRNHGVSSPLASQKIKAKRNATVIARYGREPSGLPKFRKAIESTLVHRYGKDHQKKRIRNIAQTNLRRRGIEHPLVVSDRGLKVIQIKGKRFECYGYEPQAIYYLIDKKQIHPCSIRTSRDMLGEGALLLGERKVYPDLWVKNRPVEVKSLYTLVLTYEKIREVARTYPEYVVLVMSQNRGRIPFSRKELLTRSAEEAKALIQQRERELPRIDYLRQSAHTQSKQSPGR